MSKIFRNPNQKVIRENSKMSRNRVAFEVESGQIIEVDDDGRAKRTGTPWTATAHIITAVIGSGVLSLAWATAQLGWIVGPIALFLFSFITWFTSNLLSDCYRTDDSVVGDRNHTYMDAVRSTLGRKSIFFCGLVQYVNLFGSSIGYTITTSISAGAVMKSNCHHRKGHDAECPTSESVYMMIFCATQVILSQVPNFHDLSWISIFAAVMSFTYASIAVGLSFTQVVTGNMGKTSLTGTTIGVDVTGGEKLWHGFQALGNIAFAYSYCMILIEIQDTLRSPPAENKSMKKANLVSIMITTAFYAMSGMFGYAAFGNRAPGNILTGFYEPFWLVDVANVAIILHLVGANQIFVQPLFAAIEKAIDQICPNLKTSKGYTCKIFNLNINLFRLVWRTGFVLLITTMAIMMPFFNDVLAFLGALGFWPLTVYFPVSMYIVQKKIVPYSRKWIFLKSLSCFCFLISLAAATGAIQGVVTGLRHASKPL